MASTNYRPQQVRARRTSVTEAPVAVGALVDAETGDYVVLHLTPAQADALLEQLARAIELAKANA